MAELLIVVVVVAALVLYAVDRARKLRARARQMAGMNDRLEAAADKIDEEQRRKRARVTASAELTSVMPAIKRPPLTIPGMAGHGADEEAVPAAGKGLSALDGPGAGPARAAEPDRPAQEDARPEEAPAGTEAAAANAPAAAGAPAGMQAPAAAGPSPAPALRLAESTLGNPAAAVADEIPAPKVQATPEGTLIMAPVPGRGPVRAGEARPAADQVPDERTNQERTSRR